LRIIKTFIFAGMNTAFYHVRYRAFFSASAFLGVCLGACIELGCSNSRPLALRTVCTLPPLVKETSGIATLNGGASFWTLNDGGNTHNLFEIDTLGQLLHTLHVANATNTDWEDIAQDNAGHCYIGDVGNNDNDRKDLCFYRITLPNGPSPTPGQLAVDTVHATRISFVYEDQMAFPPNKKHKNYDLEAFVWLNDSLWLFTKNRTKPFDGYTRLYCLPANEGAHTARLIDSFQTCTDDKLHCWITSAAISPDGKRLALLSSERIWLFEGFGHGNAFFHAKPSAFLLPSFTQKEGIAFLNEREVFITDEYSKKLSAGGKLYRTTLPHNARKHARKYARFALFSWTKILLGATWRRVF